MSKELTDPIDIMRDILKRAGCEIDEESFDEAKRILDEEGGNMEYETEEIGARNELMFDLDFMEMDVPSGVVFAGRFDGERHNIDYALGKCFRCSQKTENPLSKYCNDCSSSIKCRCGFEAPIPFFFDNFSIVLTNSFDMGRKDKYTVGFECQSCGRVEEVKRIEEDTC
jgi:hypothetical protein